MARGRVLTYTIPEKLRSKNEVLCYVYDHLHPKGFSMVTPEDIVDSIRDVLIGNCDCFIPAMIPLQTKVKEILSQ